MTVRERLCKNALPLLIVVIIISVAFGAFVQVSVQPVAATNGVQPLDPTTITKWENQLTGPPPVYVSDPGKPNTYTVKMTEFARADSAPVDGENHENVGLWRPCQRCGHRKPPSASFRIHPDRPSRRTKGTPITVKWVNDISSPSLFAVDPTIHWANPNGMATPSPPYLPFP